MFNTTSDGVLLHDLEGRIVEVNEAYCRMSGYGRGELIGTIVSRLDANDSPGEIAARTHRLIDGG